MHLRWYAFADEFVVDIDMLPLVAICLVCLLAQLNGCFAAAIKAKPLGSEKRFKAWTYYPNRVFEFTGYYMNPTYIEFETAENVVTITTPKPTAWQFVPNGNRLFLKPVEDNADTTATIMTNKRIYFFELHAIEAKGPFDTNLTFFVKFRYPQATKNSTNPDDDSSVIQYASMSLPDLSHPELYNFNYTMSGDENISPIKVFDDGKFTYMQFRSKGTLPAVFSVDNQGYEEITNFRVVGEYVVIEKISGVFDLRNGSDTVCIFNENKQPKSVPKNK